MVEPHRFQSSELNLHSCHCNRGVEAVIADGKQYKDFFRSFEKAAERDRFIREAFEEVDRLGYSKEERAREAMAKIVEKVRNEQGTLKGEAKTFVNFLVAKVRRFIRNRLGFKNLHISEAEAYDIAVQALRRTGLNNSNRFFNLDRFHSDDKNLYTSLMGYDKDGIEIYNTSAQTKNLTFKEKKANAVKMITDTYRGRTAKFTKNGTAYYAKLDKDDAGKLVYGDKKSTRNGYRAKINTIADGDVFELVENSKYSNSSNELGKNKGIHKDTNSWDYFDKEVAIDGSYYDVLINVLTIFQNYGSLRRHFKEA